MSRRPEIEAVVLAGGLSRRMGIDKAAIRIGGRTLLGHARALAAAAGLSVRVIREDSVARCGPLGGIATALQSTRSSVVVFLACDMPFVPAAALQQLLRGLKHTTPAAFSVDGEKGFGFPFALRTEQARPAVVSAIRRGEFSLQRLARALGATFVPSARSTHWRWMNVNTPEDLATARGRLESEAWPGARTRELHAPLESSR